MTTAIQRPTRPPFYRDVTVLKWVFQIVFLIGIVVAFWILGSFAVENAMKMSPDPLVPKPPNRPIPTGTRRASRFS